MDKIALTLSDNISCEYICSSIQKLLSKYNNQLNNKLLVIELREIFESNQNLLPKLEFKDENYVTR
jgi:hypothetical protein